MKSSNSGYYESDLGSVHISVAIVRRAVVPEIEAAENIDFASRRKEGDITLVFEDGKPVINLSIAVAFGIPIYREALNLQANVRRAVEAMTGLTVSKVNVKVEGVFQKEEDPRQ